jgi:hypothetical protein
LVGCKPKKWGKDAAGETVFLGHAWRMSVLARTPASYPPVPVPVEDTGCGECEEAAEEALTMALRGFPLAQVNRVGAAAAADRLECLTEMVRKSCLARVLEDLEANDKKNKTPGEAARIVSELPALWADLVRPPLDTLQDALVAAACAATPLEEVTHLLALLPNPIIDPAS